MVNAVAVAFAVATTWLSWLRWDHFGYRTFDLAFYVQGLWLLLRGKLHVSLLGVPLLGEHVHPIVFLLAPVFALIPHPMTLVAVQNIAIATMAPVGYAICRRLRLGAMTSVLLGSATLFAPAAGFVALHEFHPEAFTAPLLLLMFHARLRGSLPAFWIWFLAVLACKENMPGLLAAYAVVHAILDRKKGSRTLWRWDFAPMLVALIWFVLCVKVITPTLNRGQVDFVTLYSRLGNSTGDILVHLFTEPGRWFGILSESLRGGNIVWGLLLPFALLPLLRARWLVIAAPVLLQHLLSWRQSEWMIYFHYAAPLLPIFWIAMVEVIAWFSLRSRMNAGRAGRVPAWLQPANSLPVLVLFGCVAGQALVGPACRIAPGGLADVASARAAVAQVPATASVLAPLPYLSHLAMREHLYSLHHVTKGLQTLSRADYQPPATADVVIVDYSDSATFDREAGYFHPQMRMVGGKITSSSERLLHEYLSATVWLGDLRNSVAVYRRGAAAATALHEPDGIHLDANTRLVSATAAWEDGALVVRLAWRFTDARTAFPWMELVVLDEQNRLLTRITKGLCAPDATADGLLVQETWRCTELPPGRYKLRAEFFDQSTRVWSGGGMLGFADLELLPAK